MKEFLGWLNLLGFLLIVALIVFFIIAVITGDGLSDRELRLWGYGAMALFAISAVAYIVDPNSPPRSRRRRRRLSTCGVPRVGRSPFTVSPTRPPM